MAEHTGVYLNEDATKKLQEGIQAIASVLSPQPTTSQSPSTSRSLIEEQESVDEAQDTRVNCNRALQVVRSIRERLSGSSGAFREHRHNFAPYGKKRKAPASTNNSAMKRKKVISWSTRFVCLAHKDCSHVPSSVAEKEVLVDAGLGEKTIEIPDIDCTAQHFNTLLREAFPKLANAGGFELMRCIANSRQLEPLSTSVSSSPKLMKTIIGKSRVYIRPIQKDLSLDFEDDDKSNNQVKESCMKCGQEIDISGLREHVETCGIAQTHPENPQDLEDIKPLPVYVLSSDEDDELPDFSAQIQTTLMQDAVQNGSTLINTSDDKPKSLSDIVKELTAKVKPESFLLTVRRGYVFEDALRGINRSTFNPSKQLKITFLGEAGQDGGGLLREFWHLFAAGVNDGILTGEEGRKILQHDVIALNNNKYRLVGQLMAISLCQGGSGFPYLAPCVFEYLRGIPIQDIKVSINEIPDWEVRDVCLKIKNSETAEQLQEICQTNVSILIDAGVTRPIIRMKLTEKDEIIQMVALQNTFMMCSRELQQLSEGLSTLGVSDAIKQHAPLFKPYFLSTENQQLTADQIKGLFTYIGFSTAGSTEREREQAIYMYFMDLLHECEDDQDSTIKLGDVLSFFTGADTLPPLGLPHSASIYFNCANEYPTASTCALHMVLPTKHWSDYSMFKEKMVFGLKNHGGFGLE